MDPRQCATASPRALWERLLVASGEWRMTRDLARRIRPRTLPDADAHDDPPSDDELRKWLRAATLRDTGLPD